MKNKTIKQKIIIEKIIEFIDENRFNEKVTLSKENIMTDAELIGILELQTDFIKANKLADAIQKKALQEQKNNVNYLG